jgi:hypothetical protein
MNPNKPSVAYSFSWTLPAADFAQARTIIETLRQTAIELGSEASGMSVLTGDDAHAVHPEARQVIVFSATIPGASEGKYGLAAPEISSGPVSWSWRGSIIVSAMKSVGHFHGAAASLGIEVIESFAGMIFRSTKNSFGVVETEQREAFDWTDF